MAMLRALVLTLSEMGAIRGFRAQNLHFKRIPLTAGLRIDQAEAGRVPVRRPWPCPGKGNGG